MAGTVRVVHVITGLGSGGAENFLLRLLLALPARRVAARVISLGSGGGMVHKFREAGIEPVELGLKGALWWWRLPEVLHSFRRAVSQWRPNLIQGWMNHGNVAGWFARAVAAPNAKLIWSIRQTVHETDLKSRSTHTAMRLQRWLSSRPDAIVCNSHLGLAHHVAMGFKNNRMLVIPNGFDAAQRSPGRGDRLAARQRVGLDADAFVVAMIARFHPVKDYGTFLAAIALAAREIPTLRALCIGRGVTAADSGLQRRVAELGIGDICTLVDERADLVTIYPGIDVACLTSLAEAFPNVLGEAMACEIPCIATDVGDAAHLLGVTGRLVRPGVPQEVAAAMVELFRLGPERRGELGRRARERIANQYSMPVVAGRYLDLYESLLGRNDSEESS